MFESMRRSDQFLQGPGEFLGDDGVAQMRVGIPQSRDNQSGRNRIPGPAGPHFDDDIVFPSDRSFPESSSVVEPARDALHIRAKGGIDLNGGGPEPKGLGIFMAWELFLAVAPPQLIRLAREIPPGRPLGRWWRNGAIAQPGRAAGSETARRGIEAPWRLPTNRFLASHQKRDRGLEPQ